MKNDKVRFVCSRCGIETLLWPGTKTPRSCVRETCSGLLRRVKTMDMQRDAKAKAELREMGA